MANRVVVVAYFEKQLLFLVNASVYSSVFLLMFIGVTIEYSVNKYTVIFCDLMVGMLLSNGIPVSCYV